MASKVSCESFCDHLLTCSICYESFNNPKLLPCLHSFCLACITKHYDIYRYCNAGKLSCPTCRAVIPLPEGGLSGFRNDGVVRRVKELLRSLPTIELANSAENQPLLTKPHTNELGSYQAEDDSSDDETPSRQRFYTRPCDITPAKRVHPVEGATALPKDMIPAVEDPPIVTKKRADLQREQNQLQAAIAHMRNKMLLLYNIECYVKGRMENEVSRKINSLDKPSKRDTKKIKTMAYDKQSTVLSVLAKEQDLLYGKIVQSKSIHDITEEILGSASSPQIMEMFDFLHAEQRRQHLVMEEEKPKAKLDLLHDIPLPADLVKAAHQEMESSRLMSLDALVPSSRDPRKMGIRLLYKVSGYGKEPGKFDFPTHATFMRDGNLLVADKNNHRLQVFDTSGRLKHVLFEGIIKPRRARMNPADGNIYVSDEDSESIKIFSADGGDLLNRMADHFFICVAGMDFDSKGNIVMTDPERCQVSIHRNGPNAVLKSWLFRYLIDRKLPHPYYVCVNEDDQYIVSDARNNRVKVFSSAGRMLFHIDRLRCPRGVTVDPYGNILIAEGDGHCVSMYSPHGKFLQYLIDQRDFGLCYPLSLDMDKNGRLAVTQCGYTSPHEVMVFQIG